MKHLLIIPFALAISESLVRRQDPCVTQWKAKELSWNLQESMLIASIFKCYGFTSYNTSNAGIGIGINYKGSFPSVTRIIVGDENNIYIQDHQDISIPIGTDLGKACLLRTLDNPDIVFFSQRGSNFRSLTAKTCTPDLIAAEAKDFTTRFGIETEALNSCLKLYNIVLVGGKPIPKFTVIPSIVTSGFIINPSFFDTKITVDIRVQTSLSVTIRGFVADNGVFTSTGIVTSSTSSSSSSSSTPGSSLALSATTTSLTLSSSLTAPDLPTSSIVSSSETVISVTSSTSLSVSNIVPSSDTVLPPPPPPSSNSEPAASSSIQSSASSAPSNGGGQLACKDFNGEITPVPNIPPEDPQICLCLGTGNPSAEAQAVDCTTGIFFFQPSPV